MAATLAVVVAVAPGFMLGATAFLVREDLGFGQSALGGALAAFFAAFAAASAPAGRLADRVGPRRVLLGGLVLSAAGTFGVAAFTVSWWTLVLWMVTTGAAGGAVMPAATLALVRGTNTRRGMMFGVSLSAPAAASLLGGLAIPSVALTFGWRWTFALTLVLVPIVALLVPPADRLSMVKRSSSEEVGTPERERLPREFLVVAVATGLGATAAIALGSFLVETAVYLGYSPGVAGLTLAGGSAIAIASRLLVGWRADRRKGGHLSLMGVMLGVGSFGYAALALGSIPGFFFFGVVIAYGFGYGWPGLLFLGLTQLHPAEPAAAVGMVNTGGATGGALGPALFGLLITVASFEAAWLVAAAMTIVGSLLLLKLRGRLTMIQGTPGVATPTD